MGKGNDKEDCKRRTGTPMTKKRLEAYRSEKQEIREIKYRLENRWKDERMIGVDTILNYKKGYPVPECVIGFDYKKYERQQDADVRRKAELERRCEEVEQFVEAIDESVARRIFKMYYIDEDKITQQEVASRMNYSRSRISQIIDRFLKD